MMIVSSVCSPIMLSGESIIPFSSTTAGVDPFHSRVVRLLGRKSVRAGFPADSPSPATVATRVRVSCGAGLCVKSSFLRNSLSL